MESWGNFKASQKSVSMKSGLEGRNNTLQDQRS